MKKLYGILKAALGGFLGVFLGMTTYTCWDYRAHPGLYALQSAPWSEYTDSCGAYHSGLRDAGTGNMDLAKENVIL